MRARRRSAAARPSPSELSARLRAVSAQVSSGNSRGGVEVCSNKSATRARPVRSANLLRRRKVKFHSECNTGCTRARMSDRHRPRPVVSKLLFLFRVGTQEVLLVRRRHHGGRPPSFSRHSGANFGPSDCGRWFATRSNLNRHMVACNQCKWKRRERERERLANRSNVDVANAAQESVAAASQPVTVAESSVAVEIERDERAQVEANRSNPSLNSDLNPKSPSASSGSKRAPPHSNSRSTKQRN